jgi:FkbM family methyltransferase
MVKEIIRKILRSQGYDICRRDRFGTDLNGDLRTIFGLCPVKVLFDVGANEGQTAVEFAKAFPKAAIHSFEPFSSSFDVLTRVTRPFHNIKPVKIAFGDVSAPQTLFVNKCSPTNSLLRTSPEAEAYTSNVDMTAIGVTTIEVETLDDYCAKCHIELIDVLKLDVQGYERRVLQGGEQMLSRGKVAVILTEVLFAQLYEGQSYFQDLYADLWKYGFRLANIYNPSVNNRHFISWCDALFVNPEVMAACQVK